MREGCRGGEAAALRRGNTVHRGLTRKDTVARLCMDACVRVTQECAWACSISPCSTSLYPPPTYHGRTPQIHTYTFTRPSALNDSRCWDEQGGGQVERKGKHEDQHIEGIVAVKQRHRHTQAFRVEKQRRKEKKTPHVYGA